MMSPDRWAYFETGTRICLRSRVSVIFVEGKGWILSRQLSVGDVTCFGRVSSIDPRPTAWERILGGGLP